MKREYGLGEVERNKASVVSVGTFDGLHAGHRTILDRLFERAEAQRGLSTVITFDPHPRELIRGEPVPLLTTIEERGALLEARGLERFVVLPFTREFARLKPEAYVEDILVRQVGLKEIVIGYDHRFGRKGKGDSDLMRKLGRKHGFAVDVISAQAVEDEVVSSTRIRELLKEGSVQQAARLLGRSYGLDGTVVRGEGRGRKIGFPTANLAPLDERKIIPGGGVYAVRVQHAGESYGGMMNIGRRPTFDGTAKQIEAHLFEFDQSIYGERLRVEFVQRIRGEEKFEGVDALTRQLARDRRRALNILG